MKNVFILVVDEEGRQEIFPIPKLIGSVTLFNATERGILDVLNSASGFLTVQEHYQELLAVIGKARDSYNS